MNFKDYYENVLNEVFFDKDKHPKFRLYGYKMGFRKLLGTFDSNDAAREASKRYSTKGFSRLQIINPNVSLRDEEKQGRNFQKQVKKFRAGKL